MKQRATLLPRCSAILSLVVAGLALCGARANAQFPFSHLSFATYGFSGAGAGSYAHVGDTLLFHAEVWNLDSLMDSITVNRVCLTIHHSDGSLDFPNLAPSAGVTCASGDFAQFTTNIVIQPADVESLSITADIQWTDNWDGFFPGTPMPVSAHYKFSVEILRPAISVFQQIHTAPVYPFIAYDGYVTNTGDTTLLGVAVVADNGTPDDPSDDTTNVIGVLAPNSSAPYSGTYKAAGGSTLNSVSASGSDVLGLLVNRSSARSLGVGLRIASAGPHSVKISWPTFAEGFRLESTSDMGTNWTRVNQVPTPGEDGLSLTLPTSTTQFYRLAGQ